MPHITPDDLRRLSANEVIDLLEKKLGVRLSLVLHLHIAMLMGAGDQGIRVIDPTPGGDAPYTAVLDFEKLAALVHGETPPTDIPSDLTP